ncbi:MAG: hypothetical protein D5R96_07695 [Methanocalculus sp. MSAO_Arc2]|uniref:hypothetical protein n=1 Tax=Methanocalculus sp. MSAO_Arc2 TaxID=2293855 RepID=UPI000FF7624E|nr:MAG: hypothetical protein D5R96_07695 [Methanocalculus sp. MSAO_Arc2]
MVGRKPILERPEVISALKDGPKPLTDLWRETSPDVAYQSFRQRVERLINSGQVERVVKYNRIFLSLPGGGRSNGRK